MIWSRDIRANIAIIFLPVPDHSRWYPYPPNIWEKVDWELPLYPLQIHRNLFTLMNILLRAHSGLRYVVLGLLLAAIFIAYSNWKSNKSGDSKVYLFALIATHTQLLIGLILFTMSPKVNFSLISEKVFRFFSVFSFRSL